MKKFLDKLQQKDNPSFSMSLADVHAKGVFSLVIDGGKFGELTRVFIAHEGVKPFEVQFHTHRYNVRITTICGEIMHHVASEVSPMILPRTQFAEIDKYLYSNGITGQGNLKFLEKVRLEFGDYYLPLGANFEMARNRIHTMSCSPGSIWVVEELGDIRDFSHLYGVSFDTKQMYRQPAEGEIEVNRGIVEYAIKKIMR